LFTSRRKLDRISQDDVRTAVQKIRKLGAGFQILEHAGGNALVVSVPTELSSDHSAVLQLAQGRCCVTHGEVQAQLRWDAERARMALRLMLETGMAWVDKQGGG
jgi:ESCRT-II complex subunit VPS22